MPKSAIHKAYAKLHIAILLFGFTAILGRLISVNEASIVWFRLFFTCASLLFFRQVWRELAAIPRPLLLKLAGTGFLVMFHWVTFYGSIKYANVSVALSVIASAAFFTSIIEPLMYRRRIKARELLLGLLIIPGFYLIFRFSTDYTVGIILGLISAILAATFTSINKGLVKQAGPLTITFVELGSGLLLLSALLPLYLSSFP